MRVDKPPFRTQRLPGRYERRFSGFPKISLSRLRRFGLQRRRKFTAIQAPAHSASACDAQDGRWLLIGFGRQQQHFLKDFEGLRLTHNAVILLDDEQALPATVETCRTAALSTLTDWLSQQWVSILVSDHLRLADWQRELIERMR